MEDVPERKEKTMVGNIKEKVQEKVSSFAEDHPNAVVGVGYMIGLVVAVPLTIASYKYFGHCTGKAVAKELVKNGVSLVVSK